jgi:hypothetical protein
MKHVDIFCVVLSLNKVGMLLGMDEHTIKQLDLTSNINMDAIVAFKKKLFEE